LSVITRTATGVVTTEHDACVYVPLRGAAGHPLNATDRQA
jgi:hypothetical protein